MHSGFDATDQKDELLMIEEYTAKPLDSHSKVKFKIEVNSDSERQKQHGVCLNANSGCQVQQRPTLLPWTLTLRWIAWKAGDGQQSLQLITCKHQHHHRRRLCV